MLYELREWWQRCAVENVPVDDFYEVPRVMYEALIRELLSDATYVDAPGVKSGGLRIDGRVVYPVRE
jgi:hypothetical protein